MNKPHVDKLHYRMIIKDNVDYDKAPPITTETDSFSMTASKDGVVFTMKEHFDNEADARTMADRYLDEWTVLIGLRLGPDEISFRLERSEVIDLEPHQDDKTHHLTAQHIICGTPTINLPALHVSRNKYLKPLSSFMITPDVQTMYHRYSLYREGRDQLLSMAYLVLTIIEKQRGRQRAAHKYGISKRVLDRLGTLCSQGDPQDARKAPKNGSFKSLTGKDKAWIEALIRMVIERVGLIEGGTMDLPQITLADLPTTAP